MRTSARIGSWIRVHAQEQGKRRDSGQGTESAADRSQHQSFCCHAAHESPAGCAERDAYGDLAATPRRAHQHQVGDVEAADPEQQGRAGEQEQKRRADLEGQERGEELHADAEPAVDVRELLLEGVGNRVELDLGVLGRDTGSESGEDLKGAPAALGQDAIPGRVAGPGHHQW